MAREAGTGEGRGDDGRRAGRDREGASGDAESGGFEVLQSGGGRGVCEMGSRDLGLSGR